MLFFDSLLVHLDCNRYQKSTCGFLMPDISRIRLTQNGSIVDRTKGPGSGSCAGGQCHWQVSKFYFRNLYKNTFL